MRNVGAHCHTACTNSSPLPTVLESIVTDLGSSDRITERTASRPAMTWAAGFWNGCADASHEAQIARHELVLGVRELLAQRGLVGRLLLRERDDDRQAVGVMGPGLASDLFKEKGCSLVWTTPAGVAHKD
ncbi:hypothetical protein PR003_g5032 [Phytophthora rubi]|nr:hypothetical protein PR003_g5032 [Phytophthora rubi]